MANVSILVLQHLASLPLLALGWSVLGWWLAALAAPWPVWLGTLLTPVYLARVGTGAIALTNGWIVFLLTLALYKDRWPPFWHPDLPYKYWATMLLLLWTIGVGLVILLGMQAQSLRWFPRPYRLSLRLGLVGLIWLGLGLGCLAYRSGFLA